MLPLIGYIGMSHVQLDRRSLHHDGSSECCASSQLLRCKVMLRERCILTAPVQADEHASALESLRDSRIIHSLV
jgi:hypothetical protein